MNESKPYIDQVRVSASAWDAVDQFDDNFGDKGDLNSE